MRDGHAMQLIGAHKARKEKQPVPLMSDVKARYLVGGSRKCDLSDQVAKNKKK